MDQYDDCHNASLAAAARTSARIHRRSSATEPYTVHIGPWSHHASPHWSTAAEQQREQHRKLQVRVVAGERRVQRAALRVVADEQHRRYGGHRTGQRPRTPAAQPRYARLEGGPALKAELQFPRGIAL